MNIIFGLTLFILGLCIYLYYNIIPNNEYFQNILKDIEDPFYMFNYVIDLC